MLQRMNLPIIVRRRERVLDARNVMTFREQEPHTVYGCLRSRRSAWELADSQAVDWEYQADLAFPLGADVRLDDRLTLPDGQLEWLVVDVQPARQFLAVTAIRRKRRET